MVLSWIEEIIFKPRGSLKSVVQISSPGSVREDESAARVLEGVYFHAAIKHPV